MRITRLREKASMLENKFLEKIFAFSIRDKKNLIKEMKDEMSSQAKM